MRHLLCALHISAFHAPSSSSGWHGHSPAKGLAVSISPESDVAVGSTGGGLTILEPPSSDSDRPQHTTRHLSSPEPVSQMSGQEETGEEEEEVGGEVEKAVDEEEEERKREVDERVVDQVLSLFTKTPHISQYMDTHCADFAIDDPAAIAPERLHAVHEGYIDHVLNFMEDVCKALDIVYDDMVTAVTMVSKREGSEPLALVQQMDAVENVKLFCTLMHQRRTDLGVGAAEISDDEGEEDEQSEQQAAISSDEGSVEEESLLAEMPSAPSGQDQAHKDPASTPPGLAAATGPAGTPQGISAIFTSSRYGHTAGIQALLASNSRAVEQSKAEGISIAERWRERHVGKRRAWEQAAEAASAKAGGSWEEVREVKGAGDGKDGGA